LFRGVATGIATGLASGPGPGPTSGTGPAPTEPTAQHRPRPAYGPGFDPGAAPALLWGRVRMF